MNLKNQLIILTLWACLLEDLGRSGEALGCSGSFLGYLGKRFFLDESKNKKSKKKKNFFPVHDICFVFCGQKMRQQNKFLIGETRNGFKNCAFSRHSSSTIFFSMLTPKRSRTCPKRPRAYQSVPKRSRAIEFGAI